MPTCAAAVAELRRRWDASEHAETDYWGAPWRSFLTDRFLVRLAALLDSLTLEGLDNYEWYRETVGLNREQRRTLAAAPKLYPGMDEFALAEIAAAHPDADIETLRFIVQEQLAAEVAEHLESRDRYLASLQGTAGTTETACAPRPRVRATPRRRGAGRPAGSHRRAAASRSSGRGDPDLAEPPGAPGPSTEGGGS